MFSWLEQFFKTTVSSSFITILQCLHKRRLRWISCDIYCDFIQKIYSISIYEAHIIPKLIYQRCRGKYSEENLQCVFLEGS